MKQENPTSLTLQHERLKNLLPEDAMKSERIFKGKPLGGLNTPAGQSFRDR
ncbi:MAG: hypothetical protein ABSE00_10360 [Chitinispirillaceae bacterium]|jgi:hypothetical protein